MMAVVNCLVIEPISKIVEVSKAILFSKSPNYLETIESLSGDFELENLDLNSRFSDFGCFLQWC